MIQEADIGVGISGVEGMQVGTISDRLFLSATIMYCYILLSFPWKTKNLFLSLFFQFVKFIHSYNLLLSDQKKKYYILLFV